MKLFTNSTLPTEIVDDVFFYHSNDLKLDLRTGRPTDWIYSCLIFRTRTSNLSESEIV